MTTPTNDDANHTENIYCRLLLSKITLPTYPTPLPAAAPTAAPTGPATPAISPTRAPVPAVL